MRGSISIPISDVNRFGDQLCRWIRKETYGLVLRSNHYCYQNSVTDSLRRYELLACTGAVEVFSPTQSHFETLRNATSKGDWLFGFLGYDLKNQVEKLSSSNNDGLGFPDVFFVIPEIVYEVNNGTLTIHYHKAKHTKQTAGSMFDRIMAAPKVEMNHDSNIEFQGRYTKSEYIETVGDVLKHIHRGDIYEMNLCQEFFVNNCSVNPYETYIKLNSISPMPFSAFGKFSEKFLVSASPERYLQKNGENITSQPIKGTAPRGKNTDEDKRFANDLYSNRKERSENVMIVDLVRNDLSRIAQRASVSVNELFGIYQFPQVHQMISTISCRQKPEFDFVDIVKATFPMGSMTGAPKIRAMQLIEQYECSKRGLFSGAVGYITPTGNFDFNVVIRSILYNRIKKYLSCTVGGAITANSIPEKEYEECLLKSLAIRQTLENV
ncbi:MAG TPA: anthranilate synthase component I family protein [Tenuifilaceae bacterium]|nr:anthranilate synthase component I family protein [Tenuifilaceae bacterium]HRX69431.1 anthranilate synthase component I family protein [Tenuifilaceae bacterium]